MTFFRRAFRRGDFLTPPLLLADGRVDPDLTNQYGRTAITCASLNRHDSVVKLLLADDAVWIN